MGKDSAAGTGERRAAARFAVNVPVKLVCKGHRGSGTVQNMSVEGARIEATDLHPEDGASVSLEISLQEHSVPLLLTGRVVRHTESNGFAVAFMDVDARVNRALRVMLPRLAPELAGEVDGAPVSKLELHLALALRDRLDALAHAEHMDLADWAIRCLQRSADAAAAAAKGLGQSARPR